MWACACKTETRMFTEDTDQTHTKKTPKTCEDNCDRVSYTCNEIDKTHAQMHKTHRDTDKHNHVYKNEVHSQTHIHKDTHLHALFNICSDSTF